MPVYNVMCSFSIHSLKITIHGLVNFVTLSAFGVHRRFEMTETDDGQNKTMHSFSKEFSLYLCKWLPTRVWFSKVVRYKRFCIIICNLVNFWPNRICLICTGIFNFFDSPRMLCDVYFWKGGGACVRNIQIMTIKKKRLLVVMWWLESCLICLP